MSLRDVFPRRLSATFRDAFLQCVTSSILPEVSIKFPFTHLPDVLLPLLALRLHESLVDVRPQRVADDVVLLEHVEGFVQITRQLVDAVFAPLAETQRIECRSYRVSMNAMLLYAVNNITGI